MATERPAPWVQINLRPTDRLTDTELLERQERLLDLRRKTGARFWRPTIPVEGPPVEFTVTRNDHREADTFEVVYAFDDYPLDPRLIRGATVFIWLADIERLAPGAIDATDFWTTRLRSLEDRAPFALMAGVADEIENETDGDGRRVRIRGRDYTAYFLDSHLPKDVVWGDESFAITIRKLIDQRPTTQAIRLQLRGRDPSTNNAIVFEVTKDTTTADLPKLFDIRPKNYKARQSTAGSAKTKSRKKREGETVWAALQEIALEAGFILYIDRDTLVIREPQTLNPGKCYDDDIGGDLTRREGKSKVWHWTLGENVKRYKPMRRLGRQSGVNVLVTSWNPETGDSLRVKAGDGQVVEQTPAAPVGSTGVTEQAGASTGGVFNAAPYAVRGITDKAQLQKIADSLYEQLRHHELEVEIESDDLADSEGTGIWSLEYADPLILDISEDWVGTLINLDPLEQIELLKDRGWDPAAALSVLKGIDQFTLPFIVNQVRYRYSSDASSGFGLDIVARSRKQVELTKDDLPTGVTLPASRDVEIEVE